MPDILRVLNHVVSDLTVQVRPCDMDGIPFVVKYNVYGYNKLTRFYNTFDVQAGLSIHFGTPMPLILQSIS